MVIVRVAEGELDGQRAELCLSQQIQMGIVAPARSGEEMTRRGDIPAAT